MTDRIFLDTNVLVYAYNANEPEKQRIAQNILRTCIQDEVGMLSVQVLGEFFTVMTRKLSPPMTVDAAREIVTALDILPVQEIDRKMVKSAIDNQQRFNISYWDALIIAAAERSGCPKIFSEDLSDGQLYKGITVENPFSKIEGTGRL